MTFINTNNMNTFVYKKKLFFAGNSGVTTVELSKFFSHLDIILHNDTIELRVLTINPKNESLKILLLNEISHKLSILNNVLKKKLILFGIGFRSWSYKTNDLKDHLIFKIGFSRDISIEVPKSIVAISLKPTLILLKSVHKSNLSQFVSFLRSLKKPDIYKGKGVQYMNEVIKLKLGKNN